MVKRRMLWAVPVITFAMAGCNGLAGIREGIFDPCLQDAGDPACAPGSATTSSGSGSSSGSASSSATTGGAGGFRASCGNGVIDPGEECDDKTPGGHNCTQCRLDCTEPGSFKDPATSHCYWALSTEMSFFQSDVMCQSFPGGRLATVTSPYELGLIAKHVVGPVWIGASELGPTGELQWLDQEPWSYHPWGPGEPSQGTKDSCLMLGGVPLLFGLDDCALTRASLCERAP